MNYKNLTWEDIRLIVNIADTLLEATDKKEILAFGQQWYYETVLERLTHFHEVEECKMSSEGE